MGFSMPSDFEHVVDQLINKYQQTKEKDIEGCFKYKLVCRGTKMGFIIHRNPEIIKQIHQLGIQVFSNLHETAAVFVLGNIRYSPLTFYMTNATVDQYNCLISKLNNAKIKTSLTGLKIIAPDQWVCQKFGENVVMRAVSQKVLEFDSSGVIVDITEPFSAMDLEELNSMLETVTIPRLQFKKS